MDNRLLIKYPRNLFWRTIIRGLGRAALPLIARPIISGIENLPRKGPAILAGNHAAVMEIVMMAIYSPAQVEFLGTGDVPVDPKFAWIAGLYGFIPVMRGSVDRTGIRLAVNVLKQGGVIGIFPQGGIWDEAVRQSRVGVALLSNLAQAPIVPIGFGGIKGALRQIGLVKRPKLVMNIGEPIPPVQTEKLTGERKMGLEPAAQLVVKRILDLIPEESRVETTNISDEVFDVEITVCDKDGNILENGVILSPEQYDALGRFFHFPVLLDALSRNLKLSVQPLQNQGQFHEVQVIGQACREILAYLEKNPGFFTFRFGIDVGVSIQNSIRSLAQFADSDDHPGKKIRFVPIYQYSNSANGERHEYRGARSLHKM